MVTKQNRIEYIKKSSSVGRKFAREVRRRVGVFARPRLRRELKGEAGFAGFAHGRVAANHLAIINHFCTLYNYDSYLEIGVRIREKNLDQVACKNCVGVDPNPETGADFVMTSDAFFEDVNDRKFDLIFIDGLHTGEQVAKDIANSLDALTLEGTIVLHDLNPPTADIARADPKAGKSSSWCGTSWQGYVKFRAIRPDLEMYCVDTDWGCGVIRRGNQSLYTGAHDTYDDLEANRQNALNLISVDEFLERNPVPMSKKLKVAVFG